MNVIGDVNCVDAASEKYVRVSGRDLCKVWYTRDSRKSNGFRQPCVIREISVVQSVS